VGRFHLMKTKTSAAQPKRQRAFLDRKTAKVKPS
jgi:hypothetical protein